MISIVAKDVSCFRSGHNVHQICKGPAYYPGRNPPWTKTCADKMLSNILYDRIPDKLPNSPYVLSIDRYRNHECFELVACRHNL